MLFVLTGDREDDQGRETEAILHQSEFAGWDLPNRFDADAWMRPRSFVVVGDGVVFASGRIEPLSAIEPGGAFSVVVPGPRPGAGRHHGVSDDHLGARVSEAAGRSQAAVAR